MQFAIHNPQSNWQPADFISEMREQVRLWFFSMLWMGVALENRAIQARDGLRNHA